MTPQELFTKELLTYDNTVGSHDSFYYNLPYVKDYDLCNWNPLRISSGNVIKFYQYKLDKPLILFTDPGDDPDRMTAVRPTEPVLDESDTFPPEGVENAPEDAIEESETPAAE